MADELTRVSTSFAKRIAGRALLVVGLRTVAYHSQQRHSFGCNSLKLHCKVELKIGIYCSVPEEIGSWERNTVSERVSMAPKDQ